MTLTTLRYATPDTPRSRRRWPWRILIVAGILLVIGLLSPVITVRQIESRMDAITGSMTWKTVWCVGITSGPRVEVSPLETRLKNSNIRWTPSWYFLHNTHRNIFGTATQYECAPAPPIYPLLPVLKEFATKSTDTELREFVRVMQSGTQAEQEAAIDAAGEKVMNACPDPIFVPTLKYSFAAKSHPN